MTRLLPLASLALLAAASPQAAPAPAPPSFDPLAFFAGRTEGAGRLKIVLRRGEPIRVEGSGRVQGDVLVLDQLVTRGEGAPRSRQWRIRRVAPGRYVGTLSDARGPVAGQATGDRLHLRFRGAGGVRVDQRLTLAPGGRSAHNRLTARRFGITVATLDETIRKLD